MIGYCNFSTLLKDWMYSLADLFTVIRTFLRPLPKLHQMKPLRNICTFNSSHDSFIARSKLAVIDHNHHLDRQFKFNLDGSTRYCRKWSKKRNAWKLVVVKEEKKYDYIPYLMAKTLTNKENKKLHDGVIKPEGHPELLSPNIGKVTAPSTEDLKKEFSSRF